MVDCITVVIELPQDKGQRTQIVDALRIGGEFHGGHVTAMSFEDEMTVLELLEELEEVDGDTVQEIREKVKALHDRAATRRAEEIERRTPCQIN